MARVIAVAISFLVLLACMILPLVLFVVVSGLSLDSQMSEQAGWLLVAGGGLGAGAAYVTFRALMLKLGGFQTHEIDGAWNGTRKNT